MNVFITLDYEIFFGRTPGSFESSISTPTNNLLSILDKYSIKCTFFVDSGYLIKLKEYDKKQYEIVREHVKKLSDLGHSIQLHIHPHWEDASYIGGVWRFDTKRFVLNSFSESEINSIVSTYKSELFNITGNRVFAYRAGGWCVQPFKILKKVFRNNDIQVDSSVYRGGYYASRTHKFDFRNAPDDDEWLFNEDVNVKDSKGFFTELPISSIRIMPFFFWKYIIQKKFPNEADKIFGDGAPIGAGLYDKVRMLVFPSYNVVSIDGFRINYLSKAFSLYLKKKKKNFVIMGHPKALTLNSLKKLDNFLKENASNCAFMTFSDYFQK